MKTDFNFIEIMQQRVADGSIGPSTVRSMGPKKTAKTVQMYLRDPNLLRKFADAKSEADFFKILDSNTDLLKSKLPGGDKMRKKKQQKGKIGEWGERWGVARKCLNIFLYECINNRWLCEAYPGILILEPWLEVQLDSYVGCALHAAGAKSAWKNVIELTPQQSGEYQAFASAEAAKLQISRVHLDLKFYNERKKND